MSADSVVPGSANGSMDGVALKPLTVDFHEPGFASTLAGENAQPFWFQLNEDQRQQAGYQGGPLNPQALNRYSYVLNNSMRGIDPSGHLPHIVQAWKEWAVEQNKLVNRWVATTTEQIRIIKDAWNARIKSGGEVNTKWLKDQINQLDLSPESRDLLLQSAETLDYTVQNYSSTAA